MSWPRAARPGAFAAIPRGDLVAFERVLSGIGPRPSRASVAPGSTDAPATTDGVAQDWSKVIRERRSGDDRRPGDRRHGSAAVSA